MRHLRLRHNEVVVPEKIAKEVRKGGRGKPLYKYLEDFSSVVSKFASDKEGIQYLLFRRQTEIHEGEAAAMAIACCRNLPLVADEKNVKKKAGNHGIKCIDYKEWIK